MKRHHKFSLVLILAIGVTAPLAAWYYFTASNGLRMQWVFNGSCNPNSKPITLVVDKNVPVGIYRTNISDGSVDGGAGSIVNEWNTPFTLSLGLLSAALYERTMDIASIEAFINNPTPNQIWIVYDSTGSLFSSLGLSPTQIIGLGLPLTPNASRPDHICAGIVFINGYLINYYFSGDPANEFKKTLMHELGHVLGFAHSVGGGNGTTVSMVTITASGAFSGDASKLPVMFPFAIYNSSTETTSNPSALSPDDQAAAAAMYGP